MALQTRITLPASGRPQGGLLAAARPRDLSRDENRRASHALWAWTRYVWREAERVIGAPLEVAVDEQGMLAAIDRMYT